MNSKKLIQLQKKTPGNFIHVLMKISSIKDTKKRIIKKKKEKTKKMM